MSHFLSIEQLAEEASNLGLIDSIDLLETAAQAVAEAIAAKRGDVAIVDDASMQSGFGGLCVGFGPIEEGDKCPEDFREYDIGSDWSEGSD